VIALRNALICMGGRGWLGWWTCQNQRKKQCVKWCRRFFRCSWWGGLDLGFLLRLAASEAGAGQCGSAGGLDAGMRQSAPGSSGPRRVRGARHPGLLALRSASGLSPPAGAGGLAPTAFNRAGEKVRATRGQLPRVLTEVVLDGRAGSLSPHRGEGLGHRCGCGRSGAGQPASAGQLAVPEAAAGSQPVPCTTME
jgi:hypothetical protein